MAKQTIAIRNISSAPLSLDYKFGLKRSLRVSLASGASTDVSSLVTLDELDAHAGVQRDKTAGKIRLVIANGPVMTIEGTFASGGAQDTALELATPFEYRVLDVMSRTSTLEAAATLTLRTATGGAGTALSSALNLNAASDRSALNTLVTVAQGGNLYMRRNTMTNAGSIIATVQRLS